MRRREERRGVEELGGAEPSGDGEAGGRRDRRPRDRQGGRRRRLKLGHSSEVPVDQTAPSSPTRISTKEDEASKLPAREAIGEEEKKLEKAQKWGI